MSQAGRFSDGSIPPGSGVQTLTGNTGGAVPPDGANNINIVGTGNVSVDGDPGTNTLTISVTGGDVIITKFTANGTWTKNANTKTVGIYLWNGGCGGGSGRQGLSTDAGGGGGGQGGGFIVFQGLSDTFGASETVTVGAGGAGGAAQIANNSNGNAGAVGGASSVGNISLTIPSVAGAGGTIGSANGGVSTTSSYISMYTIQAANAGDAGNGSLVSGDSATDIGDAPAERIGSCGGGGGAGADAITERTGGKGGDIVRFGNSVQVIFLSGGSGGVESGTIDGGAGNNFVSTTGGYLSGGTGGGGGGGQSVGLVAGNGGDGGIPGGGGGGGGGSLNGTNSGAGGDGARGEVWVIEYT